MTSSTHPGCVYSKIFNYGVVLDYIAYATLRPARLGARVLLYCLISDDYAGGSYVDDHFYAHNFMREPKHACSEGYSLPALIYKRLCKAHGVEQTYHRIHEISERIVTK